MLLGFRVKARHGNWRTAQNAEAGLGPMEMIQTGVNQTLTALSRFVSLSRNSILRNSSGFKIPVNF